MMINMKMMSHCHVLLLPSSSFFFLLSLLTCTASSCNPHQRDALSRLNHSFTILKYKYDFCMDTFHPKTASWRNSEDCCSWEGVVCDNSTGDVIALDLSCAGLQGTINSSSTLFSLRRLRRLNLAMNDFTGSIIPEEIRVFSQMKHLDLSFSNFSGNVPTQIFQLPNLQKLDLSFNYGLYGTLPDSNWSHSLSFLSIWYCSFHGEVPHSIFTLPRLTYLDLSHNNFTGHVDFRTFSALENLRFLCLSGLSVLGEDASNKFPQLRTLEMSSCNLKKFPSFLSQSNKLRFLDLSGNMIKGAIPSWFMGIGIDTLEELYLGDNLFDGELHLPWKRSFLLDLQNNSFEGQLPIPTSPYIFEFLAARNRFSGSISPTLCQLTSLANIELGQNNLTGVLPSCLGNLTNLQDLNLSMNSLTGPLPPSMANCRSLATIDLSYNKFEGPLPLLSSATSFYSVSNNNFSGELSSLICNANKLVVIDLSNNCLTGTLPHCLKSITTGLLYFNLRVNKFHGRIPEICPNGNARLTSLDFSRNQFEGSLPRSLLNCKRLEVKDVGSNNLVDSFPDWLGHLPLKVLSLRSNKFQGHVSFSHGTQPFSRLRILDLSSNGFDGNLSDNLISEMIGMMQRNGGINTRYMSIFSSSEYYSVMINLKGVETEMVRIYVDFAILDSSSNNFRGEIPRNIGWLKALKGLNFSHNGLTGMIPVSLGNLTALESLDLSSNELNGRIPDELVKLTYLGALNLSRNNLTGPIPTGGHLNTFLESSFVGNPGLCGIPLRRSCGQRRAEAKPQPDQREDRKKEHGEWLDWITFVIIGFGSGMGIGISLGYMVLETGRPLWLAWMVIRSEANCLMKRKRR